MSDEKDKFDPVKEFVNITESARRMVEDTIRNVAGIESSNNPYPPIDIYETDEHLVLRIAFNNTTKPNNLEISVENNILTLSGETVDTDEIEETAYLQRELVFGKFSRSVKLPKQVDSEKASAKFKQNILTITLPQMKSDAPTITEVTLAE